MKQLKSWNVLKYWFPVLLWMSLIFSASGDNLSFQHTSRIIEPLLRWLVPNLPDHQVHMVLVLVRKAAHVSEYAILALLVWRLMRHISGAAGQTDWRWTDVVRTLVLVALYAASDEFHQSFIPSREASVRDVLIDLSGAVLALLLLRALALWQERSPKAPVHSGKLSNG